MARGNLLLKYENRQVIVLSKYRTKSGNDCKDTWILLCINNTYLWKSFLALLDCISGATVLVHVHRSVFCPLTQVSQKQLLGSRPKFMGIYLSTISARLLFFFFFFKIFNFQIFIIFFFIFVKSGSCGNMTLISALCMCTNISTNIVFYEIYLS